MYAYARQSRSVLIGCNTTLSSRESRSPVYWQVAGACAPPSNATALSTGWKQNAWKLWL